MKTLFKLISILFLVCIIISNLQADDKIKIRLHQPPPNQLGVKDLWKLDVTNATRENVNIFLTGTATESKKGLIVSGKSKVFSVSPGTKTYTYADFKSGEVNWKDKSIQEILLRTGNVPEGEYTICVTALYEAGEVADQESCIEQTIKQSGSITLISPGDGAELNPEQQIVFSWAALNIKGPFALKIIEMKDGQSPEVAMKENRSFFEKEGINSASFQYPQSEKKFEKGKKYAWIISANGLFSSVYTYRIVTGDIITNLTLTPTGNGCCDSIYITTNGSMFNAFRITSGGATTNTISSASGVNNTVNPATITTPVNSVTWRRIPSGNYPIGTSCLGYICFTDMTGPFTMIVSWSTDGGASFTGSDTLHITCQADTCGCDPHLLVGYDYYTYNPTLIQSLTTTCGSILHIAQGSRIRPTTGFTCSGCLPHVRFDLLNITLGTQPLTNADAGSVQEYLFNSCDSFKLTIHHKCIQTSGGPPIITECPDCILYVKVDCPPDSCSCGTWGQMVYRENGGLGTLFQCNDVLQATQTDWFVFNAHHSCISSNTALCPHTESTTIYNPDNTIYHSTNGLRDTLNRPNTIIPCGLYKVVFNATCGDSLCESCTLFVNVECDTTQTDTCRCGDWGQMEYSENGGPVTSFQCNDTLQAEQTDGFSFVAHHNCLLADCPHAELTTIYNPNGTVYNSTNNLRDSLNRPADLNLQCGLYKVVFLAACGNTLCDSCTLFVNVECDSTQTDTCRCGNWGKMLYKENNGPLTFFRCNDTLQAEQTDGFLFSASYFCIPGNCPQINRTTIYNPNGTIYHYSTGLRDSLNRPADPTFPCGLYKVVFEAACGDIDTLCASCTLFVNVECDTNQTDTCFCGDWGELSYTRNNDPSVWANCNDVIQASQTDGFTFQIYHACLPNNNCPHSESTTIYNPDGTVYNSTTNLRDSLNRPADPTLQCGLYKVVFNASCGNTLCPPCSLFVNVICDSTQTGSICDSLNATAVRNDSAGSCCWKINLSHPPNTTGISGIQFLPLSPNSFVTGSSMHLGLDYPTGWFHQSSTSTNYTVLNTTGAVPPGQLDNFFYFCLNTLSSPQQIVVNWLNASNGIICSDTVTVNCDIPCVTFANDSIICNGSNYSLDYSFTNISGFPISTIQYTVISPIGAVINPATTTLGTPVPNTQTSGNINIGISNVSPNANLCILMKFISSDGCCWCYDTLCVIVPSCVCDSVHASLTGDPFNCCYQLSLTNNYAANYFTSVNLTCMTGVTIASENFITGWGDLIVSQTQAQVTSSSSSFHIPLGVSNNVGLICFTGYTTSPQTFLVEWMHDTTVVCVETLTTDCIPPDSLTDTCSQFINDSVLCLENGTFQYNFQVQNNSGFNATGFQLDLYSPPSLSLIPFEFPNVPINNGSVSPPQTSIISGSGIVSGSTICYGIAIYNHVDSLYSMCCHSDTVCITMPPCPDSTTQDTTGCCDFIIDSSKTIIINPDRPGEVNFTNNFVIPFPGVLITQVKLQILEISVGGNARDAANIFNLRRVAPFGVPVLPNLQGDRNLAITSDGNALWFHNSPFHVTNGSVFYGPLTFNGTLINVTGAVNVSQIRLRLRYTFYTDDGIICEKDVYFGP